MSMQYNYDPNTPYACNQQNFQQNQGSSYVVNSVTWPDFRPSGDFTEVYVNNAEQNYIPEEEVQIVEEKIIPNTEDSNLEITEPSVEPSTSSTSKNQRSRRSKGQPPKKRLVQRENWKDVLAKKSRDHGLGGINRKGKIIQPRVMGPGCKDCRFKCHERISETDRRKLFSKFWNIGNHEKQWEFLSPFCLASKPKERTPDTCPVKTKSHTYILQTPYQDVKVCRIMFTDTFGISRHWVSTIDKKKEECQTESGDTVYRDLRGRKKKRTCRKRKLSEMQEIIANVTVEIDEDSETEETAKPFIIPPIKIKNEYFGSKEPFLFKVQRINSKMAEGPCFQRGDHTLKVPMSLFAENRQRLVERLRKNPKIQNFANCYVLLQGGQDVPFNDTDVCFIFRQESFFQWCFGVEEPDCYGAIEISSGSAILFFPRFPEEYATWMGRIHSMEEMQKRYAVNETYYVDEMFDILKIKSAKNLLTLQGVNSDSDLKVKGATFEGIEEFHVINDVLYPEICEWRYSRPYLLHFKMSKNFNII